MIGSENAGTSSKNDSESLSRRKPKVSRATRIVPGLVDPKVSPASCGGSRWKSRLIFLHLVAFVNLCATRRYERPMAMTFRKMKAKSSDEANSYFSGA